MKRDLIARWRNAQEARDDYLFDMRTDSRLDDRTVDAIFAGRPTVASGHDVVDLTTFVEAVRFETLDHPQPSAALSAVLRDGVREGDPALAGARRASLEREVIGHVPHPVLTELRWVLLTWQRSSIGWLRAAILVVHATIGLRVVPAVHSSAVAIAVWESRAVARWRTVAWPRITSAWQDRVQPRVAEASQWVVQAWQGRVQPRVIDTWQRGVRPRLATAYSVARRAYGTGRAWAHPAVAAVGAQLGPTMSRFRVALAARSRAGVALVQALVSSEPVRRVRRAVSAITRRVADRLVQAPSQGGVTSGGTGERAVAITAVGTVVRAAIIAAVMLAMTMSAAVAGVLPAGVQRTLATAVGTVTPFELPAPMAEFPVAERVLSTTGPDVPSEPLATADDAPNSSSGESSESSQSETATASSDAGRDRGAAGARDDGDDGSAALAADTRETPGNGRRVGQSEGANGLPVTASVAPGEPRGKSDNAGSNNSSGKSNAGGGSSEPKG
ncbi:MAG: hypothetical protein WD377_06055, partial [Nitriliruptoraceae bacterium]